MFNVGYVFRVQYYMPGCAQFHVLHPIGKGVVSTAYIADELLSEHWFNVLFTGIYVPFG